MFEDTGRNRGRLLDLDIVVVILKQKKMYEHGMLAGRIDYGKFFLIVLACEMGLGTVRYLIYEISSVHVDVTHNG
jgi:hypothetical protein